MGGAAKNGRRASLSEAGQLAQGILEELDMGGFITQGTVGGSVRRCQEEVGDVDLVLVPAFMQEENLKTVLSKYLNGLSGDKILKGKTESGIQVDVYLATEENYGAMLFTWTGSASFNVKMRARAKGKGLKLNQYGIYRGDTCIASKHEDDMFDALDMDPVSPGRR